jgi:hypothetical protein
MHVYQRTFIFYDNKNRKKNVKNNIRVTYFINYNESMSKLYERLLELAVMS